MANERFLRQRWQQNPHITCVGVRLLKQIQIVALRSTQTYNKNHGACEKADNHHAENSAADGARRRLFRSIWREQVLVDQRLQFGLRRHLGNCLVLGAVLVHVVHLRIWYWAWLRIWVRDIYVGPRLWESNWRNIVSCILVVCRNSRKLPYYLNSLVRERSGQVGGIG